MVLRNTRLFVGVPVQGPMSSLQIRVGLGQLLACEDLVVLGGAALPDACDAPADSARKDARHQ